VKVGDLVVDKEYPDEAGIIVYKDEYGDVNAYGLMTTNGTFQYFSKQYIENECEVISEGR
tara:strand:+ start:1602 stop:1781 length:180 start_codon:yes stop_codon:yes gene_type:complete